MNYRGYTAKVAYDADDRVFHGRVEDIADVISFEGESVDELEAAFHVSVDEYLSFCAERGVTPERPCSGKLVLRMSPEQHRKVREEAEATGDSINSWILAAIEQRLAGRHTAHPSPSVTFIATTHLPVLTGSPNFSREGRVSRARRQRRDHSTGR